MKCAMIVLAVALAAASSVSAQSKFNLDTSRRPVPLDRKPIEQVEVKDPNQAQAPERPVSKAQPVSAKDAKSM